MESRWSIAVIGCGNIGSRHLQGLARLKHPADIYGVEPAKPARELSMSRIKEIGISEQLSFSFHENLSGLPNRIDLAIIATTARMRRVALEELVAMHDIGALVLEKFLFQCLQDYDRVEHLLNRLGIAAWVNTPRRAWPSYQLLKDRISSLDSLTLVVESGGKNSLATNAIHYVDLAEFLTGDPVRFELDGRGLSRLVGVSRHTDTIEFAGAMTGLSSRGDCLVLRARPANPAPSHILILSAKERIVIDEMRQRISFASSFGLLTDAQEDFPIVYQSALTGNIATEILTKRQCLLPTYAVSAKSHRECLQAFLQGLGRPRDDVTFICKVT